jgi:ATP-binding cassette subfamily B protein/subfamily B ATP-binding cassette protein MsbA
MPPASKGLKPVLHLALSQWRGWLAITAATLLSSAIQLLHPWPLQLLIDSVLGPKPLPHWLGAFHSPAFLAALLAGLQVMIFLADQSMTVFLSDGWIRFGQKLVYQLTKKLFANAQRRSLLFHGKSQVGDLISRITGDSWCVYNLASVMIFTPIHALVMTLAMAVILFQLNITLALLSLAIAPLLAVCAILFGRLSRGAAHQQRESESKIESHVQQTLSGIPVVQSFAQEERQQREFVEKTGAALVTQRRSAVLSGVANLFSGGISSLGTAVVLYVGARQVLAGSLSTGQLLVFLAYLGSLHSQLVTLATTWIGAQGTAAGIDRVADLLCTPAEVLDPPDSVAFPAAPEIVLQNVTFGYTPGQPVLRGISLRIPPGETLAIVGGSGAGKSTFASLLLRLFDPDQGRILVSGIDLRFFKLSELRASIAVVLQEPFLQAISVAENIAYGAETVTREQIETAARLAGAHDFITRLDEGYDTILGESGVTLSGGERQRIALARALVKPAPILLLDEPSSSLDSVTEAAIFENLAGAASGRTTILIAHRLSTAAGADRIVVLEHGRIAEIGTHDQLLMAQGTYSRLWEMQYRRRAASPAEAS